MPQLTGDYLLFVAVAVTAYWLLPEAWRLHALTAASIGFLIVLDPISCGVVVALTAMVFAAAQPRAARSRRSLRGGILVLVALFAAVKGSSALAHYELLPAIAIPIGFGFYMLKLLHYWIESDLGTFRRHGFVAFLGYMLFFPTLLVGPLHRFDDYVRDAARQRWDEELFAEGLRRCLYGYAKVVIVANRLVAVDLHAAVMTYTAPGSAGRVLGESMLYGFYLYFAFAGYSDIAIGVARQCGFRIGENFHYPFLQRNIAAFWRCWHISLSDWCRRYVFVPVLAGSRKPALALIATMLAIGVWHELTPRYLVWGLYHGAGLAVFRRIEVFLPRVVPAPRSRWVRGLGRAAATLATFVFVIAGFSITRHEELSRAAGDFGVLLFGWAR